MSFQELEEATKKKYQAQFQLIRDMQVKQKRHVFSILRQQEACSSDTFLPLYGLHCGEFACFQILSEQCRKDCRERGDVRHTTEALDGDPS